MGYEMKLQAVKQEKRPGYPALKDHTTKRRGLLKTALGGMLALLAAGCNPVPQRTGGVMLPPCIPEEGAPSVNTPTPAATNNLPLEPPVMWEGDIAIPTLQEPEAPPPAIRGRMIAPAKPVE